MILIDGKKIAAELREELKKEVSELKSKYNKVPGLTVILVGEDPASKIYVKNKDTLKIDDFYLKCCVGKNGLNLKKKEI